MIELTDSRECAGKLVCIGRVHLHRLRERAELRRRLDEAPFITAGDGDLAPDASR